ncbi:VWA domain-containing protein [Granulicella cerasi]|uniref:VWA domain-containing protein n=1 Tax=Granulicella cerasi TaxID=741063 RepID=A0ABW1Z739_9BACT|nr:VWA domain-containing protein [Granulicella cerasi]
MGLSRGLSAALLGLAMMGGVARAQEPADPQKKTPPPASDDSGPVQSNDGIVLQKKTDEQKQQQQPAAPAEAPTQNPNGQIFSMRVDVPIVSLDVNVLLDKTHQFVPGLKPENFLVLEDGVEQNVTSVRTSKAPITAVMLLEFASTSWPFLQDMRNTADSFFRTIQPDDYIAVETFDMRTHILTDFTNNKETVDEALNSLTIPGFRETNTFDALYETLDRLTRIEGRKYIILVGSGIDSMSKLTLDKMLAKVKATPNVTIFTISTGQLLLTLADARGQLGPMTRMSYLQADNQMRAISEMTGGLAFKPIFQGELPDIMSQINESIRNQYVLTYRPTNTKNDGSYRKVKVLLVDKEGRPLKMQDEKGRQLKYSVVARDGYKAKLPVE